MSTCLYWNGAIDRNGYGTFDNKYAHRLAYLEHYGSIPDGWHIDHVCHNEDPDCLGGVSCLHRRCINVEHLEAVSPQEHVKRTARCIATINATKTQCKHGHEFTEENTYYRPDGRGRNCKECKRRSFREWQARQNERTSSDLEATP